MKIWRLIQFILSSAERGLWFDHDEREYYEGGWGFVFKLYAGPMLRPVLRPKFWFCKSPVPSMWNEFNPDYHLKIYLPFIVAPFVSVAIGRWGFYAGFKIWDSNNEKYRKMTPEAREWLAPSVSTRSTRWK